MPRKSERLPGSTDNRSQMQDLESRRLMASSAVTLPFRLDFGQAVASSVVDKDGQGTGFGGSQAGASSQLDINVSRGTLAVTADSSASKPTAALETAFDGTTRGFTVSARLNGPLSNLLHTSDQAGIYFGPDQNNAVKFTAIHTATGDYLKFTVLVAGKQLPADSGTYISVGKFADIATLDLQLTGDAVTGQVTARYALNAKAFQKVTFTMTVPAASRAAFFNSAAKAGVLVSDTHGPITATFDSFAIDGGVVAYVPVATVSRTRVALSDLTTTAGGSFAQTVRFTNTGQGDLTISSATFAGTNAGEFSLTNPVTSPITLAPGARYDFYVVYTATNSGQIRTATLNVATNDPATPTTTVALRGLGLAGAGGTYEPSLQRIIDLYQIPINVGESNPDDVNFPVDTVSSPDEVVMPRLTASGTGAITVELLGVFANQNATTKFGYYDAGSPQNTTTVVGIDKAYAQSIAPTQDGQYTFDPGTKSFGLWGNFELGGTNKALWYNRDVYSENVLNTWEPVAGRRRKVRFYQYKDSSGNAVANTYVFAFEEYDKSFDQNDIVGIIRNVMPAAPGPEIGLQNTDVIPASDHLVMSRITHPDPDQTNGVHDTSTLRVQNTGDQPLNIAGMVLSSPDFVIVSGGGAQTLAPGAFTNVVVKFVYDEPDGYNNKIRTATLSINSDDADEPVRTVTLSGLWQAYSENNGTSSNIPAAYRQNSSEPSAQEVLDVFGYKTKVTSRSDLKLSQGTASAEGEEVLSELWQQADVGLPVTVRQLAAFHGQYRAAYLTKSTISYFDPNKMASNGKPVVTKIMTHNQLDGQSLLPRIDGSTTALAAASVFPTLAQFGIRIDASWSIDQYNLPGIKPAPAHAVRVYAAKDSAGKLIPDTYIVIQDYTESPYVNYDYQDNMYVVSNLKPVTAPQPVANVKAVGLASGASVTWTANTAGDVTGYNVYRQIAGDTAAPTLVGSVSGISFADTTAASGQTYNYTVTAVAYQGGESAVGTPASVTAGSGTIIAPAAPSNVVATAAAATTSTSTSVAVTWADNANNETGFRVERKTGSGAYAAVGTVAANVLSFTDTTAVASTAYTYRVIATNAAGDSPASNEAAVTTPAPGTTPTNPTGPTTPTNPTTPTAAALTSADIGAPKPAGVINTVTTGRDYDVSVGGVDIYNNADSFNYLYQQKTGDFDVAVRVTGLGGSDPSSQAGLMVRESLAAGARNVNVKARLNGLRLTYRAATNGATTATGAGTADLSNCYLRLQRVGNVFNTYTSTDGQTWTMYGSVTMAMGSTVYVGLATCGHSQTNAATASYRGYGDTGSTAPTAPTSPTAAAPATPSSLVANAGSSTNVALAWADNATDETGYRVERQTGGGSWTALASLSANATAYTDSNVTPGTTYGYRVVATGSTAAGAPDSAASNTATATTAAATGTAATLAAVADTYVYDAAKTTAYGTAAGLQVKTGPAGYNRQAFIKFDVSRLTSVTSAKLRLYATINNPGDSVQMAVYGVTAAFNESTTTWNTKPAAANGVLATAVADSTAGQWIEIDLSAYVKQAVAAGQTTITLNLQGTAASTSFVNVASRESGSTGPQLVVA